MMLPTDLITSFASKKTNENLYENGFYTMGGVVTGLLLSDLWQRLELPGHDKGPISESLITHKPLANSNISTELLIQMALSGVVMLGEFVGVKGSLLSGIGMLFGFNLAHDSNKGKYIGQT